jgi:hypothetical protein
VNVSETIAIQAGDGIAREALAEAGARIAAAAGQDATALVESLRVRIAATGAAVLAQVNAEVNGRRIRVQEVASGLGEALDRLTESLRRRVGTVSGSWTPHPWPRTARLTPAAAPGSGAGIIARVKSPTLVWCSPDAAVRTLDAMDYDIHLFTDPATETDAVVYRVGPTGYRLARTVAAAPPHRCTAPLTLSPHSAPLLTERQAVNRLTSAVLPFLFYADPGSGRGRVLYRRFDNRLGLIAGATV